MGLRHIVASLVVFLHCVPGAAQDFGVRQSVRSESDSVAAAAADSVTAADSVALPPAHRVFAIIDSAITRISTFKEQIADSLDLTAEELEQLPVRKQRRLIRGFLGRQIDHLNNIDTAYITPQLYNYAFMVQNTNTFESFSVSSTGDKRQTLRFSPNPTFRLGGYFGWRWLFLGYTFDIGGLLGNKPHNTNKTEFDLSLYSSKIGVDLYYRRTGNDFRCTNLDDLFDREHPRPEGLTDDFSAFNLETRGFSVYYIFNHRRFSYPAAFSQSTVQRRSCGSFKAGLSFTRHRVSTDRSRIDQRLLPYLEPTLLFSSVKYNDYCVNFGYSYNWVFARRFLLCLSFTPGLAYNVTRYFAADDASVPVDTERRFSLNRLNIDLIERVGLVYNDTHYFAGLSFVLHSFGYKNENVHLNNSFGSLNFYVGFNFDRRRHP